MDTERTPILTLRIYYDVEQIGSPDYKNPKLIESTEKVKMLRTPQSL